MNNSKYRRTDWYEDFWSQNPNAYGSPNQGLLDLCRSILQPNDRILDIGAGNGRYSIEFAKIGFEISTLDLSAVACGIIEAKKKQFKLKNIHRDFRGRMLCE